MREERLFQIDALLSAEIAAKAEDIGVKKANLDFHRRFTLAGLAGALLVGVVYWFVYLRNPFSGEYHENT